MAILAQEEFAKSFGLVLVRDGVLPWNNATRQLFYDHRSKHLFGLLMQWLNPNFESYVEYFNKIPFDGIPQDVAEAINILRYEKVEKFKHGIFERENQATSKARDLADGSLDKFKQEGFYIGINRDGNRAMTSTITPEMVEHELYWAKQFCELADDSMGKRVMAREKYSYLREVMSAVFTESEVTEIYPD